jgi:plastocyanin
MRILLSAIVAGLALAAGSTGASPALSASAGAGQIASAGTAGTAVLSKGSSVSVSSLAERKAAARKKCRKIRKPVRRRSCLRRVARKFSRPPVSKVAATIDVRDKYFDPDVVAMRSGESIVWIWNDVNRDPHNITLFGGPAGVSPYDFETPSAPSRNYRFERRFTVPGTYKLACSLHHLMTMTVDVTP